MAKSLVKALIKCEIIKSTSSCCFISVISGLGLSLFMSLNYEKRIFYTNLRYV